VQKYVKRLTQNKDISKLPYWLQYS